MHIIFELRIHAQLQLFFAYQRISLLNIFYILNKVNPQPILFNCI